MTTPAHGRVPKVPCIDCDGKGHVFNWASLWNPMNWWVALFERNVHGGATRRRCQYCEGRGYNLGLEEPRQEHGLDIHKGE